MNFSIHQVPGRIRVRSASIKAEPSLTLETLHVLRQWPGISKADCNRVTGSLTVHFDRTQVETARLLDFLSERGFFPPLHRSASGRSDFRRMEVSISDRRFGLRKLLSFAAKEAFQNYAVGFLFALF